MKFPLELLQQCWFLAGPTAVGKSALSLALAERINGEILSLDSMAIYRGMDIGTAKASSEEQRLVPHHLIDLIDPQESYSTSQYLNDALAACRRIVDNGKTPLFVGGTGLYLRALLRGVFEGPPADWEFRNELTRRATELGPGWLHSELQKVDEISAKRLHPNDERRLVRALEIHHLSGKPASELQQEFILPEVDRPRHVYWLHPPRDWLTERINKRGVQMFERGLLEEVEGLLNRPEGLGQTARQALGYRETIDFLEGRITSLPSLIEQIQTGTRQFAKRQHTWFRNLDECREVAIDGTEDTLALLEMINKQN